MRLIKKKLILFIQVVIILSMLFSTMTSLAEVNVDTGDAGGDTGKGSNEWACNTAIYLF